MTADEPAGNQLREALARTAAGLPTAHAAVRLMLEHGDGPERLAAADLVESDDAPDGDPAHPADPRYASGAWRSAVAALDAGDLYASSSDAQVLRIAASLGGAVPVDLSDVLPGLDRTTLARVLAALSHTSSSHQHPDNPVVWPGTADQRRPPAPARPSNRWEHGRRRTLWNTGAGDEQGAAPRPVRARGAGHGVPGRAHADVREWSEGWVIRRRRDATLADSASF